MATNLRTGLAFRKSADVCSFPIRCCCQIQILQLNPGSEPCEDEQHPIASQGGFVDAKCPLIPEQYVQITWPQFLVLEFRFVES